LFATASNSAAWIFFLELTQIYLGVVVMITNPIAKHLPSLPPAVTNRSSVRLDIARQKLELELLIIDLAAFSSGSAHPPSGAGKSRDRDPIAPKFFFHELVISSSVPRVKKVGGGGFCSM